MSQVLLIGPLWGVFNCDVQRVNHDSAHEQEDQQKEWAASDGRPDWDAFDPLLVYILMS